MVGTVTLDAGATGGVHSRLIRPHNGPPLGQQPEQVHVHLPAAHRLITTPY